MNLIPLSFILSGLLASPAVAAGLSAAPALVHLDQELTQTLQDKQQGKLAPERVAEFASKFRTDLAAAKAEAPPISENTDLLARISSHLGELDSAGAVARPSPRGGDSRSALTRAHFQEQTTPAVFSEEKRVLGSEPFIDNRDAQEGVLSARGRRFRFASRRATASMLANLPMPPAPVHDGNPSNPAGLAALAALGATGAMLLFGGWGGDEVEKRLPGTRNRMGMAAAFGGVLATAGFMLLPAVPLVAQEEPQIASATEELQPYVVDEGKVVNRVWHSDWQSIKQASAPKGSSFCEGSCMPIHAQSAIERRGLNLPGIVNNAQHGGLYRAMENIPAQIRTSVGGVEAEIVIHKAYWHLLEFIPESQSQIPPGPK